jgi:hypothetical protein
MAGNIERSIETFGRFDPSSILEEPGRDEDVEMMADYGQKRFILAVDFGTTFSSVAYVQLDGTMPNTPLGLENVKCITRYPSDRSAPRDGWQPREDVPTELWYNLAGSAEREPSHNLGVRLTDDDSVLENIPEIDLGSDSSSESESELEPETERKEEEPRTSGTRFWGFEVQLQLQRTDQPKNGMKRVARFKLMLDEGNTLTAPIRGEIEPVLRNLRRSKLIDKDMDVISDYLTELFTHTRNELRKTPDFNENIPIEFVLAIPAVWPSKACRTMQTAMSAAVQRSGLGYRGKESLANLFIVSEPEAAAGYVLAEDSNDIYVSSVSNLIKFEF